MHPELSPEELKQRFDLKPWKFKNTREVRSFQGIIGQKRAVSALRFGLEMDSIGYNVFVAGPPGIGKMTAIQSFLEELASRRETPPDWCYVNNFDDPYQPQVLQLPPGQGRSLREDMRHLVEHIRREIPRAFESEEYQRRREELIQQFREQEQHILQQLNQEAAAAGFAIQPTPMGIMIVPVEDGHPLSEKEFQALPEERKAQIREKHQELEEKLKSSTKQVRRMEREFQNRLKEFDRQVTLFLVGGLIEDLTEKYADLPEVVAYLERVQKDIIENIDLFKESGTSPENQRPPADGFWQRQLALRKYEVNVVVDNSDRKGAPVVLELNPGFTNLFGRIEKETQFGTLYTDFTLIKGGSLHRANGGYLVVPIEDVLKNPFSWDGLKRALRNGYIQIEEVGEQLGFLSTKSLRPQPVPLTAKVILIGRPALYYLLHSYDDEFPELFKVKADFDTVMDRNEENIKAFLGFLCSFCDREGMHHLDREAVEGLLEFSARIAGDQEKLSTHFGLLVDIIREANFWAEKENASTIGRRHIEKTLEERVYRSNLVEERIREMIARDTILIDTEGVAVGQVNGLSVLTLGDYQFGRPGRITASVGPGRDGVVDIEREVELGGPIHSKGVLILGGYLAWKYGRDKPLTMSARVVFEQSYSFIDGDSASSAELYALLSALSGKPLRQGIAVTGSVNQHGQVQAIGGVNEKIEGFYAVCKIKGLTGDQGVIIPRSNVRHLMLKDEVIEAVEAGKFHIWAVDTIDQGMEILTGLPAGEADEEGHFPEGSINYLVDKRLRELNECLSRQDEKQDEEEV